MKEFNYEVYTKNHKTLENGWDIEFVSVIAENKRESLKLLKEYPFFDCIILSNYEIEFISHENLMNSKSFYYTIEENKYYRTELKPIDINYINVELNKKNRKNAYSIDLKYKSETCNISYVYRELATIIYFEGKIHINYTDIITETYIKNNPDFLKQAKRKVLSKI